VYFRGCAVFALVLSNPSTTCVVRRQLRVRILSKLQVLRDPTFSWIDVYSMWLRHVWMLPQSCCKGDARHSELDNITGAFR
jgi:hypothetical protein